ncbi:DUF4268 domain-containing protein [Bradyrhizobium sp. USDA 372]
MLVGLAQACEDKNRSALRPCPWHLQLRQGFQLNYATRERDSQVELYIDQGPNSEATNLKLFNALKASQEKIEQIFGEPLEWQELPESRGCRIRKVVAGGYRTPEAEWPSVHQQLAERMIKLDQALRPHVQSLMA